MNNKLIAIILGTLAVLPAVALAAGPYNSLTHRQDGVSSNGSTHILTNFAGNALDIKNADGKIFVQWYQGKHYIVQCTAGMSASELSQKEAHGWTLWAPSSTDPRYNWCSNNEFIYKTN